MKQHIKDFSQFINEDNNELAKEQEKDFVRVYSESGRLKLDKASKKILNSIFQSAFNEENKGIVKRAEFFNSGYKGIAFTIGNTKYYLMYSAGHVGLEDQTMGYVSLRQGGNTIWSVKGDYYKSSFGKTNLNEKEFAEAKRLFKEFIQKKRN